MHLSLLYLNKKNFVEYAKVNNKSDNKLLIFLQKLSKKLTG